MATFRIHVGTIEEAVAARAAAEAVMAEGDTLEIEVGPTVAAASFQDRKTPVGGHIDRRQ